MLGPSVPLSCFMSDRLVVLKTFDNRSILESRIFVVVAFSQERQ